MRSVIGKQVVIDKAIRIRLCFGSREESLAVIGSNCRTNRLTKILVLVFFLSVPGTNRSFGEETDAEVADSSLGIVIDGSLHGPNEIYKLIERSVRVYVLGTLDDSLWDQHRPDYPVVTDLFYIDTAEDGAISVRRYISTDSTEMGFQAAEGAYAAGDYSAAREMYRELLAAKPSMPWLRLMIGDCFFGLEQFDSAAAYYKAYLDMNPISYQAHWFYGDVLWDLGDSLGSVRHLTYAHVLNRNNEPLLGRLRQARESIGRPWKDWSYEPRYHLEETERGAEIWADTSWLGYAMTKALWCFEPGYAAAMGADTNLGVSSYNSLAEREAFANYISLMDSLGIYQAIVDDALVDAMLLYELYARWYPAAVYSLPAELIDSFVVFVDRYH